MAEVPGGRPEPRRASLARVIRIVDAGPRYFCRSALVSLAVTCLLAILVALTVHPRGALPLSQRAVIVAALAALCLIIAATLAALPWPQGGGAGGSTASPRPSSALPPGSL